jgi:hypothetical protein
MTHKLPYLPAFIALVLIIAGYHFDDAGLKMLGGVFLGWSTITHIRNVGICREHYEKQRRIL